MTPEKRANAEAISGALLIAIGSGLSQLPFPGMPDMNHLLVHMGMSVGFAAVACGVILGIVGVSRHFEADWPDRLVKRWDQMWNKKFALRFAVTLTMGIIAVAALLDAHAQTSSPSLPPPLLPTSPQLNGPCSTYVGGNNSAPISPNCVLRPQQGMKDIFQNGAKVGTYEFTHQDPKTLGIILTNVDIRNGSINVKNPINVQGWLFYCPELMSYEDNPNQVILIVGSISCNLVGKDIKY